MPVQAEELPSTIARSPDKVQRTYAETLDSAHREYPGDEERAHRTAWAAVKHVAERKGDHWELKDRRGPSDPQAARGGSEARERPVKTYGGVDVNKPKPELLEEARKAGIRGRSRMTKEELAEALARHYAREADRARRRAR
ncbi:MAG: ChaB family protein [Thermoleophilaceae bacterium]